MFLFKNRCDSLYSLVFVYYTRIVYFSAPLSGVFSKPFSACIHSRAKSHLNKTQLCWYIKHYSYTSLMTVTPWFVRVKALHEDIQILIVNKYLKLTRKRNLTPPPSQNDKLFYKNSIVFVSNFFVNFILTRTTSGQRQIVQYKDDWNGLIHRASQIWHW